MRLESDIQAEAAQWLVRRDLSEPSAGGTFENWLAADSRHRAAYLRLELAWRQADRLRKMRPLGGAIDADLLRADTARRPLFLPPLWVGVGAAIAVAGGVAWWSIAQLQPWQTYTTQIGGYQRVLLADGTTVELNTGTELKVRLSENHRRVRLLRGEASFKVAHDARRPFDVAAADTTIRAVGTEFNVRLREPQQIEVVVTQGRVALARGELPHDLPAASTISTLSAGEAAIAEPKGLVVRDVAAVEVERRLAWQDGELIFQGETLAHAAAEFNRYNRKQLSIADPALNDLKVGGNFRATDVDSFVNALRQSFALRTEPAPDGSGYVVVGRL